MPYAMKFMKNHENRRILNTHANRTRTGYNSTLQAVVHIIGTVHILHDAALFYKYHKAENTGWFHKTISMGTIRPTDKAKGLLQIQWSKQYVFLAVILSFAYNQVGCKEKEYNNEMNLKTYVTIKCACGNPKQQRIHNVHAKEAPELLFINTLTKISNEKGIARRVVFVILQESNIGRQRNYYVFGKLMIDAIKK